MLSKVYVNLIDQKEPKLNFSEKNDEIFDNKNSKIDFCKSIVRPNAHEFADHEKFLKKSLKKNYF